MISDFPLLFVISCDCIFDVPWGPHFGISLTMEGTHLMWKVAKPNANSKRHCLNVGEVEDRNGSIVNNNTTCPRREAQSSWEPDPLFGNKPAQKLPTPTITPPPSTTPSMKATTRDATWSITLVLLATGPSWTPLCITTLLSHRQCRATYASCIMPTGPKITWERLIPKARSHIVDGTAKYGGSSEVQAARIIWKHTRLFFS